jgi:hypothetical protein
MRELMLHEELLLLVLDDEKGTSLGSMHAYGIAAA